MVKAAVSTITAAVPLLDTLGCHCTAQVGSPPRSKLDTFHSNPAMELPTSCHMKVTAGMVHNCATVLIVRCIRLVHISACNRFGRALEATVHARENTVCLLACMTKYDSLLQRA